MTFKKISIIISLQLLLGNGFSQTGPLRFPGPFQSGRNLDTLQLLASDQLPDSSRTLFCRIEFFTEMQADQLFLAVSSNGGILAFSDSLLTRPLLLEKRSGFPFSPYKSGHHYLLVFTRAPGPGDYLGFRMLNKVNRQLLDEVFLCRNNNREKWTSGTVQGWLRKE